MKIEVVHKRYRWNRNKYSFDLVISREYIKVMKIIQIALKNNKTVNYDHYICENDKISNGKWYDKVKIEISN